MLKVWQKVKVEGDALIGRAAHTLVAADNRIVLYGGSADFQPRVGHCTRYFSDVYVMKTGGLISFLSFTEQHYCVMVYWLLSSDKYVCLCVCQFA